MTNLTKYLLALLAVTLLLPASAFAQDQIETITQFIISKSWDQGGDTDGIPVNGHLSCTGATTTQQDVVFTATTDAILFVYNIGLAQGQVDCSITETVPENYRATYQCNRGLIQGAPQEILEIGGPCYDTDQHEAQCFFPDVGPYETLRCHITNRPRPAVVTVTKTWVIEGADQGFDGGHWIEGVCDSNLIAPNFGKCGPGCRWANYREEEATAGSKEYGFTILKPNYPFTRCTFGEYSDDSVVETDNGCGRINLGPGADVECEMVNTVFFEGIPTLSQYGLAVLAILMLGVGFVGFRRFV